MSTGYRWKGKALSDMSRDELVSALALCIDKSREELARDMRRSVWRTRYNEMMELLATQQSDPAYAEKRRKYVAKHYSAEQRREYGLDVF